MAKRGSGVISQSHFSVGQCHGSRDAVATSVKQLGFAPHATLTPNSYSQNLSPTLWAVPAGDWHVRAAKEKALLINRTGVQLPRAELLVRNHRVNASDLER
jgi:hypothetical protein